MAWRGLHISRPASLRLTNRRLEVDQEGGALTFPLEDVAWIIVDTPQATVTTALLSKCMQAGVPVILSDDRHMPCGTTLPFHQHHRQAEVANRQIAAPAPLKKRLWQAIVRRKISNQADALESLGGDGAATLREMARHTRSGDPGNVEARAARFYWSRLFDSFRRGDEVDKRNGLLNYGYAVMRAAVARSLTAHGFLPAFGLHHRSVQNAFNLADDLLEPFRPFVDCTAHEVFGTGDRDTPLELSDRRQMAAVLSGTAAMGEEQVPILTAIDYTAESLSRALSSGRSDALVLPHMAA